MTRVAIVFGGTSSEHDISLRSADNVLKSLEGRFELVLIGITKEGAWLRYDGDPADVAVPDRWAEHDCVPVVLVPGRGLRALEGGELKDMGVDVVFPVLHGQGGEDGRFQGALETCGVPYVGCGILSSALCMDKDASHRVAGACGIRVPRCAVLRRGCTHEQVDAAVEACGGYTVYVKPARGGSSIGVSKVTCVDEMQDALDEAFALDEKVSVEEEIVGVEVGCSVVGDPAGELVTGDPDEIIVTGGAGFFRIHLEKDPGANTELRCPADLDPEVLDRVREVGLATYRALDCEGFARVDLFVTGSGEVVLNEVNTIPGLTYYSRFPAMMRSAGHDLGDVIQDLVERRLAERG